MLHEHSHGHDRIRAGRTPNTTVLNKVGYHVNDKSNGFRSEKKTDHQQQCERQGPCALLRGASVYLLLPIINHVHSSIRFQLAIVPRSA
jgi:hypothetical protein